MSSLQESARHRQTERPAGVVCTGLRDKRWETVFHARQRLQAELPFRVASRSHEVSDALAGLAGAGSRSLLRIRQRSSLTHSRQILVALVIMMIVTEASGELLRQQAELQAEARDVEADLRLEEWLTPIGELNRVGSAALGLMVWRDLDLTVVCNSLALEPVAAVGARLAAHPRVNRVTFRNDTEHWKTNPNYPDGLYLGLGYRSLANNDWKLDIWFVDEPDRQPDLTHMRWMPQLLTPEARTTILLIKSAWASRPEYGKSITSFDIYSAVLKGGVRSREEFDEWLGQPRAR